MAAPLSTRKTSFVVPKVAVIPSSGGSTPEARPTRATSFPTVMNDEEIDVWEIGLETDEVKMGESSLGCGSYFCLATCTMVCTYEQPPLSTSARGRLSGADEEKTAADKEVEKKCSPVDVVTRNHVTCSAAGLRH